MSEVAINVTKTPITISATAGTVAAGVSTTIVSTSAGGGIGPQGPTGATGPQGIPGDALGVASDVQIVGLTNGDVLTYSTTENKWTNSDTLDGGNW